MEHNQKLTEKLVATKTLQAESIYTEGQED